MVWAPRMEIYMFGGSVIFLRLAAEASSEAVTLPTTEHLEK